MEKGGWIAVIVALITTAGVVASKYLEVSKPAVKTDDKPMVPPKDDPQPAPPLPVKVDPVVPDPKPEPKVDPAPVDPPKPHTAPRVGGDWVDSGGLAYHVEQSGATFRITGSFGQTQVYAQGAVLGRELRWSYTNSNNMPGQCVGQLLPGDAQITAQCQQANGAMYMMQLARAD